MSRFSEQVLELAKKIPRGKVSTYADMAKSLGKPDAFRAVGSVLRKNRTPIIVPCHRVVRSDGSVGNYSGKQDKAELLVMEGVWVTDGKVDLGRFRAELQTFKCMQANNN